MLLSCFENIFAMEAVGQEFLERVANLHEEDLISGDSIKLNLLRRFVNGRLTALLGRSLLGFRRNNGLAFNSLLNLSTSDFLDLLTRNREDPWSNVFAQMEPMIGVNRDRGTAINPSIAADCLIDHERTRLFMKGLFEAVKDLTSQLRRKIKILYLGTGPFATLALPIMAKKMDTQFDLVDVNVVSTDNVRRIVRLLGFERFVGKIVTGDATLLPFDNDYDLLLVEAMNRGLFLEPQTDLMRHGKKFLRPGGIILPENIELGLAFSYRGRRIAEPDFNWNVLENFDFDLDDRFLIELFGSPPIVQGPCGVTIETRVSVYRGNVLDPGVCEITKPVELPEQVEITAHSSKIRIAYYSGSDFPNDDVLESPSVSII